MPVINSTLTGRLHKYMKMNYWVQLCKSCHVIHVIFTYLLIPVEYSLFLLFYLFCLIMQLIFYFLFLFYLFHPVMQLIYYFLFLLFIPSHHVANLFFFSNPTSNLFSSLVMLTGHINPVFLGFIQPIQETNKKPTRTRNGR